MAFLYSPDSYECKVYSALLGKVAGVYFGRPVEGWSKERIEEKFGLIDHYVAAENGVPLIVTDDDISGTLTFIRALADSGLYENTPDDFFGDTWLNYLIENRSILWWGGMCFSTEHTAYLRLKHGIRAPESGSMALNGQVVSEQIGAQIFIDAFGMVAPGNPALAARLAEKAARVSHDGEAVYAAQVVAAMIAAVFEPHTMDELLDIGVSVIPADSLIARLHTDVRAWVRQDGDWRCTFDRIREKYGYAKYGGGCHVIPNHALMVMAWAYSMGDFHKAMCIVTSCGWDTDCNAANVGSVCGLMGGLNAMRAPYDYLTPFRDTLYLPTADGSFAASDAANQALLIASLGRKIMKMEPQPDAGSRPLFHFCLPGSCQGFRPAENDSRVTVTNEDGALHISASPADGEKCRVIRSMLIPDSNGNGSYKTASVPLFYPGMTIELDADALPVEGAMLYLKYQHANELHDVFEMEIPLSKQITPMLSASDTVIEMGFSFTRKTDLQIRAIRFSGKIALYHKTWIPSTGWISSMDQTRGGFAEEPLEALHFCKNEERGVYVTGSRYWKDCRMTCRYRFHGGDRCGLVINYQGLERYDALVFEPRAGKMSLIRRRYGKETVLVETGFRPEPDVWFIVTLESRSGRIFCRVEGTEKSLEAEEPLFTEGGCGFLAECGICAARELTVEATWNDYKE